MIETRIFSVWDGLVGSAALIAIIILALRVMVSAVGVVILLIMLPAIIVALWNSMTLGQHLGIIAICVAIILFVSSARRGPRNVRHR